MNSYIRQTIQSYEDGFYNYLQKKTGTNKDSHQLLKKFKRLVKGQSILEIGFGIGTDAEWFLDSGFFYTGVDPTLKMCQHLHEKFPWVNIVNSDICEVEFRPETFNGIWAMASLLHLDDNDLEGVLKKCHSWLKKDGLLFVSIKEGRKKLTTDDGRFFNLFTKSRFLKLTKGLFELVDYSTTEPRKHNTLKVNWISFYLRKI